MGLQGALLALALIGVAAVVAAVISRRRPDAPTQPSRFRVPAQLDRADFERPGAPWLVVVFSSASCAACESTWEKAAVLDCEEVAAQQVEVGEEPELHQRYGIDGVPLTVIADERGVVRASFLGAPTATDLWASVAELREPGSVPEGCDRGQSEP